MQIIKFKSEPKLNHFAPEWDYDIVICEPVQDKEYLSRLKQLLLKKEPMLINKYHVPKSDGGTMLGLNSVTSRFEYFNLFAWNEPEIVTLKEHIVKQYLAYMDKIGVEPISIWVKGWYNVMRKGEKINSHWHSCWENSMLSCHFTVATEDTSTFYQHPHRMRMVHEEKNVEGTLTMFPSYIRHWTSQYMGQSERITIAMDFHPFSHEEAATKNYAHFTATEESKIVPLWIKENER